jgi:hypothetical protein
MDLTPLAILFSNVTNDTAGISGGENVVWYIPSDDTSRSNDGLRTDANAGENERSSSYPNIRSDVDWLAVFLLPAQARFQGMNWCEDLHAWSEKSVVSDSHAADIQYDAVEVEEHSLSQFDVPTVITIERRLHPYGIAALSKKPLQQVTPDFLFRFPCRI